MLTPTEEDLRTPRQVESLLNEAAFLHFQLLPSNASPVTETSSTPGKYSFRQPLHRFETEVRQATNGSGLGISQYSGEEVGSFSGTWFLTSDKPAWPLPPDLVAIPFDPLHSHFLALADCEFRFPDGGCLRGSATGQTYLVLVEGEERLLAFATGTLRGTAGRVQSLTGTFALNGLLNRDRGFSGSVSCRIYDVNRVIQTEREIPDLRWKQDPDPLAAYFVCAGAPRRDCAGAHAPAGSTLLKTALKSVRFQSAVSESRGLKSSAEIGRSIGTANVEAALSGPSEVTGHTLFAIDGFDGSSAGVVEAAISSGRSAALSGAAQVSGICTAGPTQSGTGEFADTRGIVTSHGALSLAPPALSQVHVIRFFDRARHLRTGQLPDVPGPAASSPVTRYLPMVAKLEEYAPLHRQWRESFRKCAGAIADAVSTRYNEVLRIGQFEGNPIDGSFLKRQFEAPIAPFNYEVFERYGGAARGDFRFYSQESLQQTGGNTLFSVWNKATYMWGTRRVKFITGSFERYFLPSEVPDFSSRRVDPIVNSYREDVGVVSYINVYEGIDQERTSFAYKISGPHEVMWIVKDLALNGKPADPRYFMTSHEWKDFQGGQTRYLMVGMFWEIDFEHCTIKRQSDVIWRALYVEEPGGIPR